MFAYMGGWMYHEKDADKTYDSEYLFERYLTSVGRNANLLIGCVPDTKGLISQDQVDSFVGLGNLINTRLTVHAGMSDKMIGKDRMEVWFDDPVDAEFAEIMGGSVGRTESSGMDTGNTLARLLVHEGRNGSMDPDCTGKKHRP
mgnify:CR=1 FL=1